MPVKACQRVVTVTAINRVETSFEYLYNRHILQREYIVFIVLCSGLQPNHFMPHTNDRIKSVLIT